MSPVQKTKELRPVTVATQKRKAQNNIAKHRIHKRLPLAPTPKLTDDLSMVEVTWKHLSQSNQQKTETKIATNLGQKNTSWRLARNLYLQSIHHQQLIAWTPIHAKRRRSTCKLTWQTSRRNGLPQRSTSEDLCPTSNIKRKEKEAYCPHEAKATNKQDDHEKNSFVYRHWFLSMSCSRIFSVWFEVISQPKRHHETSYQKNVGNRRAVITGLTWTLSLKKCQGQSTRLPEYI